jgi:hypothetical protein
VNFSEFFGGLLSDHAAAAWQLCVAPSGISSFASAASWLLSLTLSDIACVCGHRPGNARGGQYEEGGDSFHSVSETENPAVILALGCALTD